MDKINESNMTPIDCIKKCIERNWLSFDIEWLNKSSNNQNNNNGKPQKSEVSTSKHLNEIMPLLSSSSVKSKIAEIMIGKPITKMSFLRT